MSPSPRGKYQHIVSQLLIEFGIALKKCANCYIYCELDWIISDTTVFRPDIFIFCGSRIDDYLRESPNLIIEVLSKKTESKDKGVKFRVYQEKKVPYYLIICPKQEIVTIYHLQNERYVKLAVIKTDSFTFNLADCSLTVDFAEIW